MDDILSIIRGVRVRKKLSQQDMADRLNVDLKTYGNWERGDVTLTVKMIKRIAEVLEVDANTFWDPRKFEDKNWKPTNELSGLVEDALNKSHALRSKSKNMIPLSECEDIVHRLQEEIRRLQDQNWALSRSLNELFDKKLKPHT